MRLGAGKSGKSAQDWALRKDCLLYTSPSPRDATTSRIAAASNIEPSLDLNAKTQAAE